MRKYTILTYGYELPLNVFQLSALEIIIIITENLEQIGQI